MRWCSQTAAPAFHHSYSLGFGAAAAVTAFNRIARGGFAILVGIVRLLVTNYFDIFPNLTLEEDVRSSSETILRVMSLLGWQLKPDDDVPYHHTFTTLGVSFRFDGALRLRCFHVANKPGRTEAVKGQLHGLLRADRVALATLRSLVGVLRYARSQLFGRCGALALQILTHEAERLRGVRRLSGRCEWAVRWWLRYLDEAAPRVVRAVAYTAPVLLFTDGACEGVAGQRVTVGAVLFAPSLRQPEFFRHVIPEAAISNWGGGERAQTIGQAELAPALLAKLTWLPVLAGQQCFSFIDNDAARMSLIKGYSPSPASAGILANSRLAEARADTLTWFERVASPSNVADAPSRLAAALDGVNGREVAPRVPDSWPALLAGASWFDGVVLNCSAFEPSC